MDTEHPVNSILIVADQYRHDAFGDGTGLYATPHLNELRARGVKFTNAFTNSTICVPSRIAMATGQLPHRLGSTSNRSILPPGTPTYYQALRDSGSVVGLVGKADLAKLDPENGRHGDRPRTFSWGFTHPMEIEGQRQAGMGAAPRGPYGWWLQEHGQYDAYHQDLVVRYAVGILTERGAQPSVLPAEFGIDTFVGNQAVDWIHRHRDDDSFHLMISFPGPHEPFDPHPEFASRFDGAAVPDRIGDPSAHPEWIQRRAAERAVTPELQDTIARHYAAKCAQIDTQVGRILAAVDEAGLADSTTVVFTSDHGEMLGDHGLFEKSAPYESALRVPLIVAHPEVERGVRSSLVETVDLAATFVDLHGATLPTSEGQSVMPLMEDAGARGRDHVVSVEAPFRVIRNRRWKLVDHGAPDHDIELFDLHTDPTETENFADAEPRLALSLRRRLDLRLSGLQPT